LNYAESLFALDKVYEGKTIRQHLESVHEQTGEAPEELELPPFPEVLRNVWSKFLDVHRGRTYGTMGVNPLSYQDLLAWMTVSGEALSGWEIDVVLRLDRLWMKSVNDDSKEGTDG
jgi:hypothetical protein